MKRFLIPFAIWSLFEATPVIAAPQPLAVVQAVEAKSEEPAAAKETSEPRLADAMPGHTTRRIEGWTVHVSDALFAADPAGTEKALALLQQQLAAVAQTVQVAGKLREVPLWVSPEYPGVKPSAEYHPDAGWLRAHGRDPAMAKGVEFTNVRIFEAETRRMPNFALHELAHAYHDRVLGFNNAEIIAAYAKAKDEKLYDKVERSHGDGRPNTHERAYAMSNHREYFAEVSEAYFFRNDYFPFNRADLERHDPRAVEMLRHVWAADK